MTDRSRCIRCEICGEDNPRVIEEHHKLPQRFDGPDIPKNTANLCANCHNAIEDLFDNEFWNFASQHFNGIVFDSEMDRIISTIEMDPADFEEFRQRDRRLIRYGLVRSLWDYGLSQSAISEITQEAPYIEGVSQQRVSQFVNSDSFEEVYSDG